MSKTSRFERILLLHISPEADGQRWPNLNNLFGGIFKIMWLEQYLLLAFIMPLKEQILLFFKYNYHHSFKKNVIGTADHIHKEKRWKDLPSSASLCKWRQRLQQRESEAKRQEPGIFPRSLMGARCQCFGASPTALLGNRHTARWDVK